MIELVVSLTVVILGVGIFLAVRRAKKRPNHNPNDVYPLW
jgi:hypothetical protein